MPLIDRLAADLTAVGANAVQLLGWDLPGDRPSLPAAGSAQTLPIAEIIPFQLLSVMLAERQGLEPGAFRQIAKVATVL
jgi:glutamine---fructose-6-phosphate transaminase (isomerizing)